MASKSESRSVNIYINGDQADQTLKQIKATARLLNNELAQLVPGTEAFREKAEQLRSVNERLNTIKEDVSGVNGAFEQLKERAIRVAETMGIAFGIAEIVQFGKELVDLEVKASGIENAFSKIGNTQGVLENLRKASKGLISDLDLEKIATKANNANIPLDKMGQFLQFAEKRARDTGESVTDLTERLIEGIGKNSPKALSGLGISVQEVKADFKQTGDMVTTVGNIIKREMGNGAEDVETFGDRVESLAVKWENFKDKLAGLFQKVFFAELADPEKIAEQTDKELDQWKGYQKFEDKQLQSSIEKEQERVNKLAEARANNKKQLDGLLSMSSSDRTLVAGGVAKSKGQNWVKAMANEALRNNSVTEARANAKKGDEDYQGALNALDALQKEKEKRTTAQQVGDNKPVDHSLEEYEAQVKALNDKIRDFNQSELNDTLSKNDKEVAALQEKFNKEFDETQAALDKLKLNKHANGDQLQKIQDQIDQFSIKKNEAVNALKLKQEKELQDKINALVLATKDKKVSDAQRQLDSINEKFDQLSKDAGNNPDQQAQIEVGRQQALNQVKLNLAEQFKKDLKKITDETAGITGATNSIDAKKAAIDKETAIEIQAVKDKYTLEGKVTKEGEDLITAIKQQSDAKKNKIDDDTLKGYEEKAIDMAQSLSNSLFERSKSDRATDTNNKIKNLEQQKQAELSNTNITESQKAAIQANFDKQEADIKKQQFEADKTAAVEQALMNGAIGITKLWVSPGFPAAVPLAVALGIETLAQVATIEAQSTPAFAEGGYSAVDYSKPSGFVSRPTLFQNSSSGRAFTAGEGYKTEYIVSSEQLKDPVVADFVSSMEAHRGVKRFENGGYSNATLKVAPGASGQKQQSNQIDLSTLLDKLADIHQSINDQQVVLSWQYFQKESAKIAKLTMDSNTKTQTA